MQERRCRIDASQCCPYEGRDAKGAQGSRRRKRYQDLHEVNAALWFRRVFQYWQEEIAEPGRINCGQEEEMRVVVSHGSFFIDASEVLFSLCDLQASTGSCVSIASSPRAGWRINLPLFHCDSVLCHS